MFFVSVIVIVNTELDNLEWRILYLTEDTVDVTVLETVILEETKLLLWIEIDTIEVESVCEILERDKDREKGRERELKER